MTEIGGRDPLSPQTVPRLAAMTAARPIPFAVQRSLSGVKSPTVALVGDGVLQPAPRSANLDSAFGGMHLFAPEAWHTSRLPTLPTSRGCALAVAPLQPGAPVCARRALTKATQRGSGSLCRRRRGGAPRGGGSALARSDGGGPARSASRGGAAAARGLLRILPEAESCSQVKYRT